MTSMLYQLGDTVMLHSLVGRADLNHRMATLVGWVDGRWNAVICGSISTLEEGVRLRPSNIAAKAADAFAFVPVCGRGMGCVATRDIEPGERLVAEAPLTTEGAGWPLLRESVAALSARDRETFFALAQDAVLFGTDAPKSIEGIVGTNGMPFYTEDGQLCGGVFPTIARFNHACDANCGERWNPRLRQRTVHAVRHVPAGTELMICYGFGSSTFAPQAVRARHLRAQFGFECKCSKCSLSGEALLASDRRATAIGTDGALLSRLLALSARDDLRTADPQVILGRLDTEFALMTGEYPDGWGCYGAERLLLTFVELCDYAALALRGPAGSDLSAASCRYFDAARRWAAEVTEATRVVAGIDHPASTVWSALLRPEVAHQPAAGEPESFTKRWIDAGLTPSPLVAWLREERGSLQRFCSAAAAADPVAQAAQWLAARDRGQGPAINSLGLLRREAGQAVTEG